MKNISPNKALNKFHPIPCVFIISVGGKNKPSGMIASWIMQTSFDPPLIAVSVGKSRYTHELISLSKEFVIAVPDKSMESAVKIFGTKSGRDTDKFEVTNLQTESSQKLKVPVLPEAAINFECKVVNELDTGDHTVFVGEVLAASINEEKKVLLNIGHKDGEWVFEDF